VKVVTATGIVEAVSRLPWRQLGFFVCIRRQATHSHTGSATLDSAFLIRVFLESRTERVLY